MMRYLKWFKILAITAAVVVLAMGTAVSATEEETYAPLPKAGEKCPLSNNSYFVYGFDKNPQLGTVILKIAVYTDGKPQSDGLTIIGDSGMPSMRGHHDTGDVAFKQNKKGDYLLPVNVVMPGDWEVRLKFIRNDQVIYRGSIRFDI